VTAMGDGKARSLSSCKPGINAREWQGCRRLSGSATITCQAKLKDLWPLLLPCGFH